MLSYILYSLFVLACLILVVVILLQPGKADAGALFSNTLSSTAFGPRAGIVTATGISALQRGTVSVVRNSFASEIARGLDVLELTPTKFLTQNEIDAAKTVQVSELNVQNQQKIEWPRRLVVAKAYVDQLER